MPTPRPLAYIRKFVHLTVFPKLCYNNRGEQAKTKFLEVSRMSRPKGSKNLPKTPASTNGELINLGGGVPITPAVTVLPTVEPTKKVSLGRVQREKIFRAAPGQLSVHESTNGNVNFKGRMVDENGIVYMTTMFMPLNPATGKAIQVSEADLDSLIG